MQQHHTNRWDGNYLEIKGMSRTPKPLLGAIYTAPDRGPWRAEVDPLMGHARIASDDASHDVVLRVDGNFKTLDEKRAYTEDIARRLNDSIGPLRV